MISSRTLGGSDAATSPLQALREAVPLRMTREEARALARDIGRNLHAWGVARRDLPELAVAVVTWTLATQALEPVHAHEAVEAGWDAAEASLGNTEAQARPRS